MASHHHQESLRLSIASWIVETLPREVVADHAPFLLEAVERRYVEAVVEHVHTDSSEPMVAILVEDDAGEYLAQGIVVRDASPDAVTGHSMSTLACRQA